MTPARSRATFPPMCNRACMVVLGGLAKWPMTNVRQLGLPHWRRLAAHPENRRMIPLTEFAEWAPRKASGAGLSIGTVGGIWRQCVGIKPAK